MGGFRAKDADRDRYVDVIEAAYVDGQLGEQDRELRVSRALTAETLDELDALTRDLQNRPRPVVAHRSPPPVVAPTRAPVASATPAQWPVTPKDGGPLRALGVVAAGVFAVAVWTTASADRPTPEVDYSAIPWSEIDGPSDVGYEMSASDVRRFLRRYESRFDTDAAYEVGFFSDRVSAHVPLPGSHRRFEVWTWDGDWRRDARPARVDPTASVVDLSALDVAALFDNIEVARRDLGVRRAELSHVLVRPAAGGGTAVTIHVRNGFGHRGFLQTTPQGEVVGSVPHEG